jgi:ribosomal protein S8
LTEITQQKIEFRRVARKCLKHRRGDKEMVRRKYEKGEKKYLKVMEENGFIEGLSKDDALQIA